MVQYLAARLLVSEPFVYVHTVIKTKGEQWQGTLNTSIRRNFVLMGENRCHTLLRMLLRTNSYNKQLRIPH